MNEDTTFSGPWYRDRWPWLIISVPAISVVLGIAMLMLAIDSYDGLVAEDYYKQGLAVNEVLDREAEAKRLGLRAEFGIEGGQVSVVLHGAPRNPGALSLRLVHPTRAGEDVSLRLRMRAGQIYTAAWPQLGEGRWHAMLQDEAGSWRMTATWQPGARTLIFGEESGR